MFRNRQQEKQVAGAGELGLSVNLLGKHVAAERNTPV